MNTLPNNRKQSLGRRTLNAGGWSMFQVAGTHGLRLGSNLIMTRILVPEAFGLMALVGVLVAGFTSFTDIGINRSIVREADGDQDHFLQVAWAFKIIRGIAVASAVLLAAAGLWWFAPILAPAGSVYADPRLPALVGLSALVPLLLGFESTTRDLAARNLHMKYITFVEVGSQVMVLAAMLIFVSFSPTVWALMAGMLTGALMKSVSTHLFLPGPKMRLSWDSEVASRIWHYGKWLMLSSIFAVVSRSADQFILGALLSASTFGIFAIAKIWMGAGMMVISRISDQVGFPAIGEMIRNRPEEVPRLYRKFQTVIDAMCIAAFLVLLLGGQLLIRLLYTPTYEIVGSYLAILSVGFLSLRFSTLNGLIMNLGKSKEMMVISGTRAISICILLPVTYTYLGMAGALLVIAINPLITAVYTLFLLRPFLGAKQIKFDFLWLVMTLIVAAGVFWMNGFDL